MFEIKVKAEFEAAHRIAGYPGKCNRLHGHNWVVEAAVRGCRLDSLGMLLDFKELKKALKEEVSQLDHRYLNELEPFGAALNPTAENLAQFIFASLKQHEIFAGQEAKLYSIRIWETQGSSVLYQEEE